MHIYKFVYASLFQRCDAYNAVRLIRSCIFVSSTKQQRFEVNSMWPRTKTHRAFIFVLYVDRLLLYVCTYNVYIYYVWASARVRCVFSVVISVCGFLFLFSQCFFSLSVSGSVKTCGCYISLVQSELRFDSIRFVSVLIASSAPLFICMYIFSIVHIVLIWCCWFFSSVVSYIKWYITTETTLCTLSVYYERAMNIYKTISLVFIFVSCFFFVRFFRCFGIFFFSCPFWFTFIFGTV